MWSTAPWVRQAGGWPPFFPSAFVGLGGSYAGAQEGRRWDRKLACGAGNGAVPARNPSAGRSAAVAFDRNPVERRKMAGSLPKTNTNQHRQLRYESNPKHRDRWQRGRRGSLCPKPITLDVAKRLLLNSKAVGGKRYAVHEGRAYRAQEHRPGVWHGYPVGWVDVPKKLRLEWICKRRLRKRDEKRHWEVDPP